MSSGRGFSPNSQKNPKPVKQISLSEKHITLRVVLFVILLIVGFVFIFLGIRSCASTQSGWQEIEVDTDGMYATNLRLYYNIGQTDQSNEDEKKALQYDYTLASINAYKLYSLDSSVYSEGYNVGGINANPNVELSVPNSLYNALYSLTSDNNRYLFQGPLFEAYNRVFNAVDDSTASSFDPNKDSEMASYLKSFLKYTNDSESVSISFLGNGKIQLNVSNEYFNFLQHYSCSAIIDFGYLREAAYVDDIADTLISAGYTYGYLATKNASFVRNFASSKVSINFVENYSDKLCALTTLNFEGSCSVVDFSTYINLDEYFYEYSDGSASTPFIEFENGLNQFASNNVLSYSNSLDCLDIAGKTYGYYVSKTLDKSAILGLKNIHSLFMEDGSLYCDKDFMSFSLNEAYSSIPIVRE